MAALASCPNFAVWKVEKLGLRMEPPRRDRTGDLLITNPVLPIMADVGRDGFRVLSIS